MFPTRLQPIIPIRRRDLFDSADWVDELKHDGFRALAYILAKAGADSFPAAAMK